MKRGLEDKTVTRGVSRRVRQTNPVQTRVKRSIKKPQLTKKNNTLLPWGNVRFLPYFHEHVPFKQDYCKYCKHLALLEKDHDPDCKPRKIKRPKAICNVCRVHLCKEHFTAFIQLKNLNSNNTLFFSLH